jgi:hypothetical protein
VTPETFVVVRTASAAVKIPALPDSLPPQAR